MRKRNIWKAAPDMAQEQQLLDFARRAGVVRPRDLAALGVSRTQIQRMVARGALVRIARGLYTVADAEVTEHHSLVEAAARVPRGVICLLSALAFHDLTTQNPFETWLAIPRGMGHPVAPALPLRIVRFSGLAYTEGVEEHQIEGVRVCVYGPAKTVADCFKYRHKIGLDVALEALRAVWSERRASMDEIWHYAEVCRVARVMRPYLESLI